MGPYSTCEVAASSVVQETVAPVAPWAVATTPLMTGAVGSGAGSSWTRSSKLVCQPLLLPTVTEVQPAVQPVTTVATWAGATPATASACPAQRTVTVVAPGPPL